MDSPLVTLDILAGTLLPMSLRIILIRHGRSEANEAEIWQGQGDAPLSVEGRRQVGRLAERFRDRSFDLVISSDLQRARDTADALGGKVEEDPEWREIDLGGWEGRTFSEVAAHHPDLLDAIRHGEAMAFGETGETLAEFEQRVLSALDRLVARVGEGQVVVATHGGVIDTIVGRFLGRIPGRRTFPIVTNTSLTTLETGGLRLDQETLRLATFNDSAHLGHDAGFLGRCRSIGTPVLGLLRHGVTAANKEGRVQGSSCWGLDEEGHLQARAVSEWYGPVDHLISSPLDRAQQTAAAFGVPVETDPDLAEMSFGSWEGKQFSELVAAGDEQLMAVYRDGADLPRGGTGETFAQVLKRMGGYLERVRPQGRTLAVSHGAAIRALVGVISGRGSEIPDHLGVSRNTGVSHVALGTGGPLLVDYSVAPHLERR